MHGQRSKHATRKTCRKPAFKCDDFVNRNTSFWKLSCIGWAVMCQGTKECSPIIFMTVSVAHYNSDLKEHEESVPKHH